MPKVSKRGQRRQSSKPEVKYLRTYIYVRLSEKDGGHGRRDSIYIQKQICEDYAKKHPEMLVVKVYADNGVTGTTFQRDAFEELMEDVANKKVDCIIVKDFARFGRDALDAVDLIDVIFPTLNIRFVSVMDEYDSANPACVEDRTTNILKHFMNDYYAREVSEKLVQAHRLSRERGEFWGSRPPYGYQRAEENSKKLVPEPEEAEIIRQIFYWYVFEELFPFGIRLEDGVSGQGGAGDIVGRLFRRHTAGGDVPHPFGPPGDLPLRSLFLTDAQPDADLCPAMAGYADRQGELLQRVRYVRHRPVSGSVTPDVWPLQVQAGIRRRCVPSARMLGLSARKGEV